MWLFLNNSYVSVEGDPEDQAQVWVRSTNKKDLEFFFKGEHPTIKEDSSHDHKYGVKIDRIDLSRIFLNLPIQNVAYPRLLPSVKETTRARYYRNVWSIMMSFGE